MEAQMAKVYVIRHGETDYNVENRYCGRTNIDINENGIVQARLIAEKLKDNDIDSIIASSMIRAKHTADIINSLLNVNCEIHDSIIEIGMGVYEGLTKEEIQKIYPEMWAACSPKGRESEIDVQKSVFDTLEQLKDKYKDKNILIVTHGYITKVIYKYFTDCNNEEFKNYRQNNCEIKVYEWK